MKRMFLLVAAGLTVVALAGAVGLPDLAGAQDPADTEDSITVSGVGSVDAVPNEATMSFGAETRGCDREGRRRGECRRDAQDPERAAPGGRTRARDAVGERVPVHGRAPARVNGYAASNSVSAVSDVGDAPALIDAAAEAGANQISGPGLSSSNAEALYRQALGKAIDDARLNAQALAKAAGRSLGPITTIVEGGASGGPEPLYRAEAQAADSATPIVPGEQETSATISVTFSLR